MATRRWTGAAQAVAQVTKWTFGGTWESDDQITLTINSKTVTASAGSTDIPTILDALVLAIEESTEPDFAEIEWSYSGNDLIATGPDSGKPFTCTVSTTESGGGAADLQTIDGGASSTGTNTTSPTGPNWLNEADNWSGNTLPVDGDTVLFTDSSVDVLYGLDLSAVTPAEIRITSTFTGRIGLPAYDPNGTYEYRERFCKFCNSADLTNTAVYIGQGLGSQMKELLLNFGTGQVTIHVEKTGVDGVTIQGTHTSNAITILSGTVRIAPDKDQSATFATVNLGADGLDSANARLVVGPSATVSAATFYLWGGRYTGYSTVNAIYAYGGTHEQLGGGISTLRIRDATFYHDSYTEDIGSCHVFAGGRLVLSRTQSARSVDDLILTAGAALDDRNGNGTYGDGITLQNCSLKDVDINVGNNWTYTLM